MIAIDIGKL